MEVEEMEMQARKRWRIGNGREELKIDDDDDDGEGEEGMGGVDKEEKGRLLALQSSRIFRVSRASGGKDRHSKVLTAKGLRDRRIRLSVSTAIQFYDLQDRLRCDQPSKAVEWLIKAAAQAIAKLPALDGAFPTSPKEEASDEKRFDPDVETEPTTYLQHQQTPTQSQSQQQLLSLTKSACSSTSETSKGSVLSLSRSENRVKARERARERTAKEKEKEKESNLPHQQNANPNTQSSFTDLLTGCNDSASATTIPSATAQNPNPNFIPKQFRHFPPMDYFGPTAIYGQGKNQHASGFSGQAHFGNPPLSGLPLNLTAAANAVDHPELTQYAFLPEHLISVAAAPATSPNTDHNLNFSISSSLAGFNRGTLQSNSQSSLSPHMQRFPSPIVDALPNAPFFIGTAAPGAAVENQFPAGFDGRLQLCYGDGCRQSDLKGKGKKLNTLFAFFICWCKTHFCRYLLKLNIAPWLTMECRQVESIAILPLPHVRLNQLQRNLKY
eukprot:TRINITY_DN18293_c0_g1_i2.p1 TRINITY_DN18293_c0_g1~~TRINITY_DN18293_c0_g1_i2.p1  ORF type:complete len:498 (+),score=100.08 TRINITY_DN18293_c0_g1_i2:1045-2538(+)